jgi:hypothetical protein
MTNFNYLICELLAEQKVQEDQRNVLLPPQWYQPRERRNAKRAFASTLVRLGLRLDPAAGEGLGARNFSFAQREAR